MKKRHVPSRSTGTPQKSRHLILPLEKGVSPDAATVALVVSGSAQNALTTVNFSGNTLGEVSIAECHTALSQHADVGSKEGTEGATMSRRQLCIELRELPPRATRLSQAEISTIFGGCKGGGYLCNEDKDCCTTDDYGRPSNNKCYTDGYGDKRCMTGPYTPPNA